MQLQTCQKRLDASLLTDFFLCLALCVCKKDYPLLEELLRLVGSHINTIYCHYKYLENQTALSVGGRHIYVPSWKSDDDSLSREILHRDFLNVICFCLKAR